LRTLLAALLVIGASVFDSASERALRPLLRADEPPPPKADKKGTPGLKINRETTYITAPLDKDGNVDYVAALTELLGKGVTPENNANVLLIKALGPGAGDRPPEYYKLLGMDQPRAKSEQFVDLHDYLKNNVKLKLEKLREKEAELDRALIRPWTAKTQPDAAAWLKANEKPLALVIEASKRRRYYSALVSRAATFDTAPRYELIIDKDAAERNGVSIEKALDTLNILVGSTYEHGVILFNQSQYIPVRTPPGFQRLPEDLANLFIRNDRGEMVPYSALLVIKKNDALTEIAKALVSRAMLHLGEKQWDAAWNDLLACHRLAMVIGSAPTFLDTAAACTIDAIASQGTLVFIGHADISAQQLLRCLADLRALPPLPDVATNFEQGERLYLLEMAMRVRKEGLPHLYQLHLLGEGRRQQAFDKKFIAEKAGPETRNLFDDADWNRIFRECNRSVDDIVAALRENNPGQREERLQKLEEKQKADDTRKTADWLSLVKAMKAEEKTQFLLRTFTPRVEGVRAIQSTADRSEQIQRSLQIAFALAAYHRAEGKYPKSLDQLVPKYLARVPTDYFTNKPMTYRVTEKGYELRSAGARNDDRSPFDLPNITMPLPAVK
jgi:hypothetical protein